MHQNWRIIFEQTQEHFFVFPAGNYVGQAGSYAFVALIAGIIINLFAIKVECGLMTSSIIKTMKVYGYAGFLQGRKHMEKIKYTPIIDRVGYSKGNDVDLFFQLREFGVKIQQMLLFFLPVEFLTGFPASTSASLIYNII